MIKVLMFYTTCVLAIFVFLASVCRLAPMNVWEFKLRWIALYQLAGIGALLALLDASHQHTSPTTIALLFALSLYYASSWLKWFRRGPPAHMRRG